MKLSDVYSEAIRPAVKLLDLYDKLLTINRRNIRPELAKKFYRAKLTKWPQQAGLWRSEASSLVIFGTDEAKLSHRDFTSDALLVLPKVALVMQMAAVDKLLHDSLLKRFTELTKEHKLDDLVRITLSESYQVAVDSQKRRGKGGNVRKRPSARLKAEVIDDLYRKTFLGLNELKKIASLLGKSNIFALYRSHSRYKRKSVDSLETRWKSIYAKRNHITHECDIVRKTKAKKVHFNDYTAAEIKRDTVFVQRFGEFLAKNLE